MSTENVTFEVALRSELTELVRAEILSLCNAAYGIDFEPIIKSYGGPITHVLLRVDDELVSHALWIPRWLQVGSGPLLHTAFVEAVATSPLHRRRGYASLVMRKIAEEIQDFEIGGLAPSDYQFYEKLGWELWTGPLLIRKENERLATPPEEQAMILRLPKTPKISVSDTLSVEWREGEVW